MTPTWRTLLVAIGIVLGMSGLGNQVASASGSYEVWLWDSCLYSWNWDTLASYQIRCDPANYHDQDDSGCYYHAIENAWIPYGCVFTAPDGRTFYDVQYTDGVHMQYSFALQGWMMYTVSADGTIYSYSTSQESWVVDDTNLSQAEADILARQVVDILSDMCADGQCTSPPSTANDGNLVVIGGSSQPQLYCTDSSGQTTECEAPGASGEGACIIINDSSIDYDNDGKTGLTELEEYCAGR